MASSALSCTISANAIAPAASAAPNDASAVLKWRSVNDFCTPVVSTAVDDGTPERQVNLHLDAENLAGVYANFANVSFSDYEFTLTFARIDHEVEDGEIPGVVVSRVNVAPKFLGELLEAMKDSYSKWQAREAIRNLPESSELS